MYACEELIAITFVAPSGNFTSAVGQKRPIVGERPVVRVEELQLVNVNRLTPSV